MRFFFKQLISIDRAKINAWVALRNTLGVTAALTLFICLGKPTYALVAGLGALVVSYSDADDAYPSRARRLLFSSVLCATAVFLGPLTIQYPYLAFSFAVLGAFAAGFAVALGTLTDLFLFSLVMFIIFSSEPLTVEKSTLFAFLTALGGLLQTGLSVMLWPIRRYEPERRELGTLYLEFGRLLSTPLRARTTPLGSAQINRAHLALSELRRERSLESDRYLSLLSQAERIRISLLYLLRRKRSLQRKTPSRTHLNAFRLLSQFLERVSEALGFIAQILLTSKEAPKSKVNLQRLGELIKEAETLADVPPDTLRQMIALFGQLRAATGLASRSVPTGTQAFAEREARRPGWLRFQGTIATLRANFTLRSAAFRHGVRMALAIAVGEIVVSFLHLERSYWTPMTIVLVLKPEFTTTLSRGLLRVLGTLAGLVFATLLFHVFPRYPSAEFAMVIAFMFLLRWIGAANYGIFAFMLSGLVVSLLTLTGVDPNSVILARGLNTCVGGAIALLTYSLWRTWARHQVEETIAEMLDTYRQYFRAVSELYFAPHLNSVTQSAHTLQTKPALSLDAARLASRLARSNQEVASAHTVAEPGTSETQLRLLRAMQASSNRFAYNVMALEAGDPEVLSAPQAELFARFAEGVEQTLSLLSEALRNKKYELSSFPNVRELQLRLAGNHLAENLSRPTTFAEPVFAEIDRVTNSLNTLREQIIHWLSLNNRLLS